MSELRMKKFFQDKDVFGRFKAKTKNSESDCIEWTGCINNKGYGEVRIGNKKFFAHRAAWIFHFGEIPDNPSYHGLCVCHKCDNRKCVNPEHLFLGTNNDNIQDMRAKGRRVYSSKIKVSEFDDIKNLHASGISYDKIAEKYNVSYTCIRNINLGRFKSEHLK